MKSPKPCANCGDPCHSSKLLPECAECARRRMAGEFWSPPILDGGRWVLGPRRVLVWQPDAEDDASEVTEPTPLHALIACPTCRARVGQTCRTRSGHTTTPHDSRLAPRLCECGALLAKRRRYCDPCRDRIDKENRYAGVVRFRARKAVA